MDNNATYDDGKGNASDPINGHYVIGEFTADSSTVPITITATGGTDDAVRTSYRGSVKEFRAGQFFNNIQIIIISY